MAEEKDTKATAQAGNSSGTGMRALNYTTPTVAAPKVLVPLVRSDNMIAMVQFLNEGGENNLHSHTGMDGFWFVLSGRVRFYGEGNEVFGEFGAREGVYV